MRLVEKESFVIYIDGVAKFRHGAHDSETEATIPIDEGLHVIELAVESERHAQNIEFS
jgi:hypothetical protein